MPPNQIRSGLVQLREQTAALKALLDQARARNLDPAYLLATVTVLENFLDCTLDDLALLRRNSDSVASQGGDAGRQKYFLYFHSAAAVRGMAFLVWKEPGRDADRR